MGEQTPEVEALIEDGQSDVDKSCERVRLSEPAEQSTALVLSKLLDDFARRREAMRLRQYLPEVDAGGTVVVREATGKAA